MKIPLFIIIFCYCSVAMADENKDSKKESAFLNIGGYVDSNFSHANQGSAYSNSILPSQNSTLPSINRQNSANGAQSRTHSRIDITGGIKLNENTTIGASVVMNSLINQNDDDRGSYANQNFLFIETKYGRSEVGVMPSAGSKMRIDATSIARATGGIGGDWWRFVNFPHFDTSGMSTSVANELSAGYMPIFMLSPMLPNEAGFTTGASSSLFIYNGSNQVIPQMINGKYDAMYYNRQQPRFGYGLQNSISYYTPRYNGFQIGISYAPDTGNAGGISRNNSSYLRDGSGNPIQIAGRTSSMSGDVRNYISVGLNYKEQFDNLGVALSGTYEHGNAEDIRNPYGVNGGCGGIYGSCINGYNGRRDLSAWSLGGKLLYGGLSIAGSYGSWGHSLQPNKNNATDGSGYKFPWLVPMNKNGTEKADYDKSSFHNIGIAYGFGPINFSITHINTNYMGNKMSATSFGTDFKVGSGKFKGLVPYIEYTNFSMKGAPVFLQSTGIGYEPIKNTGHVITMGIRVIF